jgi:predicted unusual protein kinase regulating ubiquinone biosynthesis (AarF/ABC1/UbiB family)
VIGEVEAECIRLLENEEEIGKVTSSTPSESFGLDANQVTEELMGAPVRNKEVDRKLHELFQLIDSEDFDGARQAMIPLIGKNCDLRPEIIRAQSLIKFLEAKE